MVCKRLFVSVAALLVISMPEEASARSIYFYKAGVDRDTFAAEALECESLASGVQTPPGYQPYSSSLYAAGAAALLGGFLRSRERRGIVDSVLRTCMADKGYRRIEASKEIDEAIERLSGAERLERLAMLASGADYQGRMLPR